MHVLGVDQRTHRKKRTSIEKVFQRINTLVLATQLATLLVTVGLIVSAGNKSMANSFFSGGDLQLNAVYYYPNCTHTYTTSNGLFTDYTFEISIRNIEFVVARAAYNIRRAVAMYATMIAVGGVNKLLFDLNIYDLRIGYVHIRKDIFTTAELFLMVLAFITTNHIERENGMLKDYMTQCARVTLGAQADTSNLFQSQVPFVAFYVGLAISAFVFFLSILAALYNMWVLHPKDILRLQQDQSGGSLKSKKKKALSVYGGEASSEDDQILQTDGGYQRSDDEGPTSPRMRQSMRSDQQNN